MGRTHRLAAIDIGTVTTRLLVADVSADGIADVERSTDITHLGEGLTATGRLSREAIGRVADVIERYHERVEALDVERVVALATSASRDAENAEEFGSALAGRGIRPMVIPGSREAELSFLGATSEREGKGLLVVDCGGGSTELVLGEVEEAGGRREMSIAASRSIDVGSKRMTELYLHSDPPRDHELDAARAWATAELRPYFDRLDDRPQQMIAVAGTATTLAAISQRLEVYDASAVHDYVVTGPELSDLLDMLASLPLERRLEVVGLHPRRAGVIVAGTLILETVLALAGLDEMIVSEHDILYGILLDTYRDLR